MRLQDRLASSPSTEFDQPVHFTQWCAHFTLNSKQIHGEIETFLSLVHQL